MLSASSPTSELGRSYVQMVLRKERGVQVVNDAEPPGGHRQIVPVSRRFLALLRLHDYPPPARAQARAQAPYTLASYILSSCERIMSVDAELPVAPFHILIACLLLQGGRERSHPVRGRAVAWAVRGLQSQRNAPRANVSTDLAF